MAIQNDGMILILIKIWANLETLVTYGLKLVTETPLVSAMESVEQLCIYSLVYVKKVICNIKLSHDSTEWRSRE